MAHRIKIKLGDAEFEAEGTEESVQSQYEMFLAAMQSRSVAPTPSVAEIKQQDQTPPPAFTDNLIARIFELRPDDVVALRALPKGQDKDADALLLLLYRLQEAKERGACASHTSAQSLVVFWHSRLSTGPCPCPVQQYIIRGGQKKGTTYALNNRGIAKAEEIAARVFQ